MKIVFSAAAKAGLRKIALYIARDNNARAISFVRELRTKAMDIAKMPRAVPLIPRYEHQGIRQRPYGKLPLFLSHRG